MVYHRLRRILCLHGMLNALAGFNSSTLPGSLISRSLPILLDISNRKMAWLRIGGINPMVVEETDLSVDSIDASESDECQ